MEQLGKYNLLAPMALAVILVATLACGSDAPAEDAAPSPGEYLEVCGLADRALEGSPDESFSLEELAARFGDVIRRLESMQSPEEFADWHEATVAYLKAVEEVLRDAPGPGEGASREEAEDYAIRLTGPVAFQHLPGIFEIIEGMDADDVALMVEAGCVDEGDIGVALEEEASGLGPEDGDGIDGGATAEYLSVSAGDRHTCGVRTDGSVACWGHDGGGESTPPDGEFVSVSAGSGYTCGVRIGGTVECWSLVEDGLPDEPLVSVSNGRFHTCGVRTDGSVACWGDDSMEQATPPEGEFVSASAGNSHTCGVRTDGSVACWGDDSLGQATPPEGRFVSVSAGGVHTCGVRPDGSVECWGWDNPVKFTPLGGSFASVSSGATHACAVMTDGTVGCWGAGTSWGGKIRPPSGPFARVSAGESHTCGVRRDGSVECWGSDEYGQASPQGAK